jgi:hypothetical protein
VDEIQLRHERAVGDRVIDWLNQRDGSHFTFSHRGKDAPHLLYGDAGRILGVEVAGAYYDNLLRNLELPDKIPFVGVYLLGNFPMAFNVPWSEAGKRTTREPAASSPGGLHIWQLWPIPPAT